MLLLSKKRRPTANAAIARILLLLADTLYHSRSGRNGNISVIQNSHRWKEGKADFRPTG